MTITLARRRRRRLDAPVAEHRGCTCPLRHPCSVAEREQLAKAAAGARRAGKRDLAACLATRLSTPCRTCEAAAALLAGTDWLEGLAATGPLCPCGCGHPPEKHVQQYTATAVPKEALS